MPKSNRPKGLTIDGVCEALKATNGNISLAAHRLGVDRSAVQYYVATYPNVREVMQQAAAAISDIAEGHLVSAVRRGDLRQVQYWLENKARDRGYGQRTAPNVNITLEDLMAMDETALDKLIAQLGKLG